mmetsp:Transcript_22295/g.31078  ORF Transcript_22295/g.31078 Transcript_22295/m.31078 type:complete len:489 (+) Transcript_22295:285-1751(+)
MYGKRGEDPFDDASAPQPPVRPPPRLGTNNSSTSRQSSEGIEPLRSPSVTSAPSSQEPEIIPATQVPFSHDYNEKDQTKENKYSNSTKAKKDVFDISEGPSFFPNEDVEQESVLPGAFQVEGPGGDYDEQEENIVEESRWHHEDERRLEETSPDLTNVTEEAYAADAPGLVQAVTVPDLVVAVAKPEDDEEDNHAACFCCGIRCCSVKKDSSEQTGTRKRMYLIIGSILAVVILVAVGISLGSNTDNQSSSSTAADPSSKAPIDNSSAPAKLPSISPTNFPKVTPTNSPTKAPTNFPTKTPTKSPTKAPTVAPTREVRDFFTGFNYTHSFYGHMFDITAKKDIIIVGMYVHLNTEPNEAEKLELYTKPGTYVDYVTDSFQWARLGGGAFDVVSNGRNQLTPLPDRIFSDIGIRVREGEKRSFYVTSPTSTIVYFQERKDENGTDVYDYGAPYYYNDDMTLNVGTGVQHAFENMGPPNIFNGLLEYVLD